MDFIKGDNRDQITLLPDSIDEYVSDDNPVRVIDAYIDQLDFETLGFSKHQPNDTGRPMYDPKDLLKLYLYGYMNRIRSSRRLEQETKRNLEVIWLLRKISPDHKTIARFRCDNASALKNVFRDFMKLCMKLELYGKELVAIDGSKFKAVNANDRNFSKKKLHYRMSRIDVRIEDYLRELEEVDSVENATVNEKTSTEIIQIITKLAERKELYQSYADEMDETGTTQISLTDPDSRTMMVNGKLDVCYNVQTAVDGKNKMIVEFEAINDPADQNHLTYMAKVAADAMETDRLDVTADAGYNSATDLANCVAHGITPHVADADYDLCILTDEPQQSEINTQYNGKCVYIPERNIAICPMGQVLYPGTYNKRHATAIFWNSAACTKCKCKCSTAKTGKRFEIAMTQKDFTKLYNDENLHVKQVRVKCSREILCQRKTMVEHPFGTIKRNMNAGYCLTKGLKNVNGEFSLLFLAYNLKRAINILGTKKLLESIAT